MPPIIKKIDRFFSKVFILLIIIYQKTLSPDQGFFKFIYPNGFCRFYPHCSEYGRQAFIKYGTIKGTYLSIWRIMRCNPWSKGGFDPIK